MPVSLGVLLVRWFARPVGSPRFVATLLSASGRLPARAHQARRQGGAISRWLGMRVVCQLGHPSQENARAAAASGTLARPGTGRPGRRPAEDRQIPPAQRCASPPARPNVAGHVLPARMPATARSAAPSSARSSTTRSARCSPAGGASQSCADSPHQSNAWRSALAHSHVSVHLELRDHLRSSGSQGLCGVDISFDHSNISEDNEISGEPVRERDGGSSPPGAPIYQVRAMFRS